MASGSYPTTVDKRAQFIERQLDTTRRQVKLVELSAACVTLGVGLMAYLFLMALVDHWLMPLGFGGRLAALATLIGGTAWYLVAVVWPLLRNSINPAYAARAIEQSTPTLKNSLINFLMLRADRGGVHDVVYEAVEARAASDLSQVPLDTVVDYSRLIKVGYVLAGVFAICAAYKILSPKDPLQTIARVAAPWADIDRPSRVQIEDVTPGDTEQTFGDTLTIRAAIRGLRTTDRVQVVYSTADGQTTNQAVPMTVDDSGLVHSARLPADGQGVQQNLTYRLEAGDAVTRDFQMQVVAAPTIVVEKLVYDFPRYTQKPQQVSERTGDIKALEGTRVTVEARANQPVHAAYIEFDPQSTDTSPDAALRRQRVALTANGDTATGSFLLELAGDRATAKVSSYQVTFMTAGGHPGQQPALHTIEVIRDLPPEIEILTPAEQTVAVPVNGEQVIELRAVDADFALRRVSLKMTSGAREVAEEILLDSPQGHTGQWVQKFKFRPAAYQLQPGEEITLWAVAADNRIAPKSNLSEPNTERTKNYFLKIVAADPSAETSSNNDEGMNEPMPGENEQPMAGQDQGGKQGGAGEKKSEQAGDKQGDQQNEQQDQGNKQKKGKTPNDKTADNNKPEKGDPNQGQQKSGDKENKGEGGSQGQEQNGDKKQSDKPKDGPGQGKQPADDKTEQKPDPSKPQQDKSDKSGKKKPDDSGKGADSSGENDQGGEPDPNNKQQPKPGDNASGGSEEGQPSDPQNASPMNNSPMNSSPTKPGGKSEPGSKPMGQGGAEGSEEGAQEPSSGNPPGSSNDTKQSGKPQSGNSSGQPQKNGSQAQEGQGQNEPREPLHDGEAIEKALEHLMQKAQEQKGAGGEKSPMEPEAQSRPLDESLAEKAREFARKQQEQAEKGDQPGEPSSEGASAKEKPADGANPENAKQGSGANNQRGQGETGKPDGKANTKPEQKGGDDGQSSEKKQGGMGNNGESGSGRESKDKSGAAQAQETNTDRAKQQRPDDQKAADSQEAQSPSGSKKQSDSQGSEGGDRSGGGKKGPGQGANAAGNDKAGSNNPADEGAGTAKETGMGETGTKGGDQKRTDKKTGSAGTEEGDGSSTQKDPRGNKPASEPLKGEPAPMGDQPPQSPQASAEKPSQGGQKGPVTGGGLPGEQDGDSPQADADAPAAEAAKIDYARQATDLVLDYLKDQKEQPDQQLLDELGWSKEDLKQFLSRWEAAQRDAKADPSAKHELDEALRSLGLRPHADTLRRGATRSDNQRGLGDVNNATGAPPSKYLEQFKAFKKGAARGK